LILLIHLHLQISVLTVHLLRPHSTSHFAFWWFFLSFVHFPIPRCSLMIPVLIILIQCCCSFCILIWCLRWIWYIFTCSHFLYLFWRYLLVRCSHFCILRYVFFSNFFFVLPFVCFYVLIFFLMRFGGFRTLPFCSCLQIHLTVLWFLSFSFDFARFVSFSVPLRSRLRFVPRCLPLRSLPVVFSRSRLFWIFSLPPIPTFSRLRLRLFLPGFGFLWFRFFHFLFESFSISYVPSVCVLHVDFRFARSTLRDFALRSVALRSGFVRFRWITVVRLRFDSWSGPVLPFTFDFFARCLRLFSVCWSRCYVYVLIRYLFVDPITFCCYVVDTDFF